MKALIHFNESYQEYLEDIEQFFTFGDGELDVIVDNIPSLNEEELCDHYDLDYDEVLSIDYCI